MDGSGWGKGIAKGIVELLFKKIHVLPYSRYI